MKNSYLILLLFIPLVFSACKTKTGCTDAQATNFDPKAKEDDGSCIYFSDGLMIPESDTLKDDGNGLGNVFLTADREWYLEGTVFINAGQLVRVEPGTVIRGLPGEEEDAAWLVVAKGGQLFCEGKVDNPIIFTAAGDDPLNPFDIPVGTRGLWGGVAILGNAPNNLPGGIGFLPGISETDDRREYGGSNCSDNSGVLRYVSIRYAGENVGFQENAPGLALMSVGDGTILNFVEVAFSEDDGVGISGGCVNLRHMISVFNGDDSFDFDEGYNGKGQFWFSLQSENIGDRAGEVDGGVTPEDAQPYSLPKIWNSTFIGGGNSTNNRTFYFKDNAGGEIHNSIFTEFDRGIFVERTADSTIADSWDRFNNGDLFLANNLLWNVAENDSAKLFRAEFRDSLSGSDSLMTDAALRLDFENRNNQLQDPQFSLTYNPDGTLDPVPLTQFPGPSPTDSWFHSAPYLGAFDGENWMQGWTYLYDQGYF